LSSWAVLVAAGRGERLGEDRPKAFVRLGGLPLLAEPLRRLDESPWVDAIVVVAPPEWEEPTILLAEEVGASKVSACVTGGETRASLGLTADDSFTIHGLADLQPGQDVAVEVTRKDGTGFEFTARCRIDTANEMEYYRNGGILQYVLRRLAS